MTTALILAGVIAAFVTAAGLARYRYAVVTVQGVSMKPALREGDRLLVRRTPLHRVRSGQIVVVRRPVPTDRPIPLRHMDGEPERWVIKRAAALPGEPVPPKVKPVVGTDTHVPRDHLVVLGDNAAASVDSRTYGYLHGESLLGVVVRPLRQGVP